MAEVFISYKRERRRAAEHLARIIEAHGFSVWYDHKGLVSGALPARSEGTTVRKQIERELRAAEVVLVLWCDRSRESDWVEDEARLAKRLGTYVPVRIAPEVDPPLGLGGDHFVDLAEWDGAPGSHLLHSLFREIERRVGRAGVVRRADLERIDGDWRLYGAPRLVTFEISPPRRGSAVTTIPIRRDAEATLRPLRAPPRLPIATLRVIEPPAPVARRSWPRALGWLLVLIASAVLLGAARWP